MIFIGDKGKFLDSTWQILLRYFKKLKHFPPLWKLNVERANSGIPPHRSDQNLLDRGSVLW